MFAPRILKQVNSTSLIVHLSNKLIQIRVAFDWWSFTACSSNHIQGQQDDGRTLGL